VGKVSELRDDTYSQAQLAQSPGLLLEKYSV